MRTGPSREILLFASLHQDDLKCGKRGWGLIFSSATDPAPRRGLNCFGVKGVEGYFFLLLLMLSPPDGGFICRGGKFDVCWGKGDWGDFFFLLLTLRKRFVPPSRGLNCFGVMRTGPSREILLFPAFHQDDLKCGKGGWGVIFFFLLLMLSPPDGGFICRGEELSRL